MIKSQWEGLLLQFNFAITKKPSVVPPIFLFYFSGIMPVKTKINEKFVNEYLILWQREQRRERVRPSPPFGLITIWSIKHLLRTNNKSPCDGVMAHSKCFLLIKWASIWKTIFKFYPQNVKERTTVDEAWEPLSQVVLIIRCPANCVLLAGGKCSLGSAALEEALTDRVSNPGSPYLCWMTLDLIHKLSRKQIVIPLSRGSLGWCP